MLTSAEALLLDAFDLQDRDRIVVFLTRERGKVRGVAKGARRKYSRFAGQLQPLAKVKVTWFESEGRDLVRISGVEPVRSAGRLLGELEDILLTSYLAEHLLEFAQENEPAELYFRLLDSTVEALLARRRSRPGGALLRDLDAAPGGDLPVAGGVPGLRRRARRGARRGAAGLRRGAGVPRLRCRRTAAYRRPVRWPYRPR